MRQTRLMVGYVAIALSVFHLYTGVFGIYVANLQRSLHVGLAIILAVLMYNARGERSEDRPLPWSDWGLIALTVFAFGYLVWDYESIAVRDNFLDPLTELQWVVGGAVLVMVMVMARRVLGWALTILAGLFILYGTFGHLLPGFVYHRPIALGDVVTQLVYSLSGIFGIPVGISATYAAAFIVFGAFLEKSGAGQFFIDLSVAAAGRYRGGPAKVAVASSALMGTISGSAVANVLTTGAISIPLMKRIGYRPHFAGAVEAAASTGGQLMPPIMGATAFIVAEFAGVPYISIALAATIPAILYFLGVYFMVDLEAARLGLKGLPKHEVPALWPVIKTGIQFLIPVAVITYMLLIGVSALRAAIWGVSLTVLVSWLRRDTRMGWRKIVDALAEGGRSVVVVAAATAAAGIIIGIATQTGLALKFSQLLVRLSAGNLLLALFITMIVSLVLGMGMPTSAAYVLQAGLVVPALVQLGVSPIAAHLFVFFFGCLSVVTPPVALAAYAAAGLSGSDPIRTGFTAWKLTLSGFIVPFMFVYSPTLLLDGAPGPIALSFVTAVVGVYCLSCGVVGHMLRPIGYLERVILLAAALTLIKPGLVTDLVGLTLLAAVVVYQRMRPDAAAEVPAREAT